MDELIKEYASQLATIHYKKIVATPNSFASILRNFLREVDDRRAIPHNKLCQQYGHALVTLGTPEACRALEDTTIFET